MARPVIPTAHRLSHAVFLVQIRANRKRRFRIHCAIPLLHALYLPLFIHHNGSPLRPLILIALDVIRTHNPVSHEDFPIHIAKQWEGNANLFSKSSVCSGTVDAYTEDNRITCFELGQISLIGL
jgi:hypothetical protein